MWRQPDSARTSEQLSACVGDCARSNSGSGEKVDTSTKTTQRVDHLLDTRRPQRNLHLSRSRDLSLRLHRHRGQRDHNHNRSSWIIKGRTEAGGEINAETGCTRHRVCQRREADIGHALQQSAS